jgi:radical SAM protein with 4Fe4S-binding SPASM domain
LLCTNAWEFPAIHFDGTLMPCGLAEGARFAWGDLKTQSWMEAYNTLEFQQARHLAAGDSTAVSPCLDCWKMRPMRERLGRGVPLQVVQLAR